ncbi:MAG: acyltransferase family protein, partial [Lactobacillaceae bacterium]|nr:acyltransferase family protein [Lactobacillaceae bacterium]
MAAEKQRLIWIDYGKGITILFVVIAHVLKGLIEGNLVGDLTFSLTLLNMVIFTFIMPVFFALSGYLYRPVTNVKDFFRQIKKRAISLLIPYLIFSVLFVLLQHLSSSGINNLISWNSLLFIFIKPITYLWYLYALFLIFLLFDFLSLLRISAGFSFALAIIAVSLAAILPIPEPLIFVFRWAIFFLIGYVLKVKNSQFSNIYFLMLNVLVFIFSLIIQKNFDPTWAQTNEPTVYNLVSKIVSVPLFFSIFN